MIRLELTLLDDAVVLCTLYGRDGRVLGHGRGTGPEAEAQARVAAAREWADAHASENGGIPGALQRITRFAPSSRFTQDAARILGKVGR